MRRGWLTLVVVVTSLAACSSPPVLLDEGAVDDVASAEQNTEFAIAPGWTWCSAISPSGTMREPYTGSRFELDDGSSVGATVLDRRAEGLTSAKLLGDLVADADQCTLEARPDGLGTSIEPLTDLEQDAHGWRTRDPEGRWGEYVVVPLDEWRVLAYGFVTRSEEPPVDLDELGELAREGAERLAPTEG
ncbi:hypothetical protein [Cellulomonas pakistanensis]|uniref:Lipoprotein n=1 Tax=Cellulomonas pakistanensis TaxID=992287 RepID=A0A919U744_9CELL|nr:hypothetical protein [Cellulomonas pakistanensis]GIG36925.1 hypothetical protein Cpa01nite_23060 [Cellulomonas pakistanensis]